MCCQFAWVDKGDEEEDINNDKRNNQQPPPPPETMVTSTITTVTTIAAVLDCLPRVQTLFAIKMQGNFLSSGLIHNESTSVFHLIALVNVFLFDKSNKIRQPCESL
jgi:hypothetical protein